MDDFPDIEDEFYKANYLLPTPCIYKLSGFIKSLLLNKVQGAIVVGETCYGKTTAISYLTKELLSHYGEELPVFNIDCKYGIKPEEVETFLKEMSEFSRIRVRGLMTIAPIVEDKEEVRPYFRKLRELSKKIKSKNIKNVRMDYLSMGMTEDFEIAIEEGANMVRIGRGIFGFH